MNAPLTAAAAATYDATTTGGEASNPLMIAPLTAACIAAVATAYDVPAATLWTLLAQEGGHVGQVVHNTNGTVDIGPFQINSIWVHGFAVAWREPSDESAFAHLRDRGCWNAAAAAAIMRIELDATGDLMEAIGRYHSARPELALPYIEKYQETARRLFRPPEAAH